MDAPPNSPARPLSETPDIDIYLPLSLDTPIINETPLPGNGTPSRVASPARPLEEAAELQNYHEIPSSSSPPPAACGGEKPLVFNEYHSPGPQISTPAQPLEGPPRLLDLEPLHLDESAIDEVSRSDSRTASPARPLEETPEIGDYDPWSSSPERLAGGGSSASASASVSESRARSLARTLGGAPEIEDYALMFLDLPVRGESLTPGSRAASLARPLEGAAEIEDYGSSSLDVPVANRKSNMASEQRERIASWGDAADERAGPCRGGSDTLRGCHDVEKQHLLRTQRPDASRERIFCKHDLQRYTKDLGKCRCNEPPNGDRELIDKLRANTQTQSELVTELKIRVAVLENDLKHTEKHRDEALHSSAVMTRVLGSAVSHPQSETCKEERDELARENKMLKRENAVLWKRLESRKVPRVVNFADSTTSDDDLFYRHGTLKTSRREGRGNNIGTTVSAQRGAKVPNHSNSSGGASVKKDSTATSALISKVKPTARALNAEERAKSSNSWDSFESGITTVPNSPVISPSPKAQSSQIFASTNSALQPGIEVDATNVPRLNHHIDAGLQSLEDVLGGAMDGFPPPLTAELQPNGQADATRTKLFHDEGRGIDTELEEQMALTVRLDILPAPVVLKTGFDVGRSFRGYDHDAHRPRSFQSDHLSMRDYNRFAPFPPPRCAKLSFSDPNESNSSFEPPSDRSQSTKLWASAEERECAIEIDRRTSSLREDRAFPDFFRYGIQFVPAESDTNYFRTVVITNIPQDVDLRELLAKVRGGDVVSAVLMDTVKITGSMSAMVQFLQQGPAEDYVEFVREHPLKFPYSSQPANATLLSTPTWPLSIPSVRRIKEHYQTRLLSVLNFPETISISRLERDLAQGSGYRASSLVEIFISERNTLHLEFSSINAAGSAFGILTSRMPYRQLEICFERDPCTGHLHELSWDIPPRPPMLPRGRKPSLDLQITGISSANPRRERSADGNNSKDAALPQRKRLAALQDQHVSIPSFSGVGIQSSSWADEVINELGSSKGPSSQTNCYPAVLPNSPLDEPDIINAVTTEDINQNMASGHFGKPPVGLAGSKYASLVPGFDDQMTGPRGRTLPEKLSRSSAIRDLTVVAGVTSNMRPGFYDEEISESERSYAQTATRALKELEEKRLRAKSPPRVDLASLLASPPLSPTILPSHSLADDGLKVEIHPFEISNIKNSEKCTAYLTPQTSIRKHFLAGSCSGSEEHTKPTGLKDERKQLSGEIFIDRTENPGEPFSDLYLQNTRQADLISSQFELYRAQAAQKHRTLLQPPKEPIIVTPDNPTTSSPTFSPLNSVNLTPEPPAAYSERPLPGNIDTEFQRGLEAVLREDPFGHPISIPPLESAVRGKWCERTPLPVGVRNPDEIDVDVDDENSEDLSVEMLKPRVERGGNGKVNFVEKNLGEGHKTPSRGKAFFDGDDRELGVLERFTADAGEGQRVEDENVGDGGESGGNGLVLRPCLIEE